MAEESTTKDPNEEHDRETSRGYDPRNVDLSEGSNRPPPQAVPYKITGSGK